MVKYIERLLKALKVELLIVWLIVAAAVALGEIGVIPNGLVIPNSEMEFKWNTAVILLTIVGIPVALRLFVLNTTRGLRRMNNEEALNAYHVWSAVRMGILCVTAVLGVVAYYVTMNTSGVFCALEALLTTLYCWPSCEKVQAYLEGVNNE